MEEVLIKKVDELILEQKKTNQLLNELIKLFRQYDSAYNITIEKEGFVDFPK